MQISRNEQQFKSAQTRKANDQDSDIEQRATETFVQHNEIKLQNIISYVKLDNFSAGKTEEEALQQILHLLVCPLNGEWNQRAQLLAEQQSLGEYILAKLEKVKSDRSKTYCVSILAVLGMLSVVLERARTAHREGKEYGGNFMIYGETEFRQEEQENMIRMRDELVSQYNRHNQVILDKIEQQQSDQTEVEKLGHDVGKCTKQKQIDELKQEIYKQQFDDESDSELSLNNSRIQSQQNEQQKGTDEQSKKDQQQTNERMKELSKIVNQTDQMVDQKQNEVINLEKQAKERLNQIQQLKYISHKQQKQQQQQSINYKDKHLQEPDEDDNEEEENEEIFNSERNEKSKQKEKEKKKQRQKEQDRKKEEQKQKQKEKERNKQKEIKKERIKVEQKVEQNKDIKENQSEQQEKLNSKEKVQTKEKVIEKQKDDQISKQQKISSADFSTIRIRTEIQIADFKGIISRTGAVIQTIKAGGIAVVNANQDVPKDISYNEMINMKGILLALPEFALYMNGKLLWKRDQTQPIQQPQQQSSQSSTSQILPQTKQELKPFPVWAHLCLQLNMESDQRIAKFFIGPDLGELVGVGVSGLPDEIKVVVLSSGALKAFQAFNTQRVGDAITSLVQWSDLNEEKEDDLLQ